MGVISGLIGGSLAAIIIGVSNKRTAQKKTLGEINEKGDTVMKGKTSNKFVTYFCYVFGIAALAFSLVSLASDFSNAICGVAIGLFFILIGFFYIRMTNDNRIEYNNEEIRQYRILRKSPNIIRWSELENIEYVKVGPMLKLINNETKIYVEFRYDGIIPFIEFASTRVSEKNARVLKGIL